MRFLIPDPLFMRPATGPTRHRRWLGSTFFGAFFLAAGLLLSASPAIALEKICDVANENCRTPLLNLINSETTGIDVSFWFMEDTRYATALINRWKAGVPVRVLM